MLHPSRAKLSLAASRISLFFSLSGARTGGRMDPLARGLVHKRPLSDVSGREARPIGGRHRGCGQGRGGTRSNFIQKNAASLSPLPLRLTRAPGSRFVYQSPPNTHTFSTRYLGPRVAEGVLFCVCVGQGSGVSGLRPLSTVLKRIGMTHGENTTCVRETDTLRQNVHQLSPTERRKGTQMCHN